jgi:hypothetical protein
MVSVPALTLFTTLTDRLPKASSIGNKRLSLRIDDAAASFGFSGSKFVSASVMLTLKLLVQY